MVRRTQEPMPTPALPPTHPASIYESFAAALNAGSLEGIMALYEERAVLLDREGKAIVGAGAIRDFLAALLGVRPRITIQPAQVIDTGQVALLAASWEMSATGPNGEPITDGGRTRDVLHRQPDGTWRVVIDSPWGVGPK